MRVAIKVVCVGRSDWVFVGLWRSEFLVKLNPFFFSQFCHLWSFEQIEQLFSSVLSYPEISLV